MKFLKEITIYNENILHTTPMSQELKINKKNKLSKITRN